MRRGSGVDDARPGNTRRLETSVVQRDPSQKRWFPSPSPNQPGSSDDGVTDVGEAGGGVDDMMLLRWRKVSVRPQ
ncbi:hypothetical protein [Clavibacter zhangzhiyongii]|uniref:hypothetical protein n=1 Tax=Clavibacter zhangzhiyongii TaxID=2768071 RepID=UPI0039E0B3F6